VAIDLSGPDPTYLVLYATGVRGTFRDSFGYRAYCYFGDDRGNHLTPSYVGPQGQYPGLDQVNILLPSSLNHDVQMTCEFQSQDGTDLSTLPVALRFK
jgi:hypothetical protein